MKNTFKQTKHISELLDDNQRARVIFRPTNERIVGRTIKEYSPDCGTYGLAGVGFFGLQLEACNEYPQEWLMLRIYDSPEWLTVNGEWLEAKLEQYHIRKPLTSNYKNQKWDNFSSLIVGKKIDSLVVCKKSMRLVIDGNLISLDKDPAKRPPFINNIGRRILFSQEDLRDALIIAPWPEILV
jgi:hypothetical protein